MSSHGNASERAEAPPATSTSREIRDAERAPAGHRMKGWGDVWGFQGRSSHTPDVDARFCEAGFSVVAVIRIRC